MALGEGILAFFGAMLVRPLGLDVTPRAKPMAIPHRAIEPTLPTPTPPKASPPAAAKPVAPAPQSAPLEAMPLMERKPTPHILKPAKAAEVFVKYMQDAKTTGPFASEEIDEFWRMCCDELNLYYLSPATLRNELEGLGLLIGRPRLRLMYPEIRMRIGRDRATLYSIPARGRSVAGQSGQRPASPRPARPEASQRPDAGHASGHPLAIPVAA